MMLKYWNLIFAFIFALSCLLSSCNNSTYHLFQTMEDSTDIDSTFFEIKIPTLEIGDKITVSIWQHEDLSIGSVNSTFNTNEATGRWLVINEDGEVNLPQIGRVRITGYTIKEANYFLEQEYSKYIKNPIINIKVLNQYVTILGEVGNAGKYRLDNEVTTLIEILGEAKGLTEYAKSDEIQLIRKEGNELKEIKIDFTDLKSLINQNVIL